MAIGSEMRLERRWIPAFAGMTPGRGGQMFPETQLRNPSRMHCFIPRPHLVIPRPHRVIPAKAGIHAFCPGLAEYAQRKHRCSGTVPDATGRGLTPLFHVIPAKVRIHAFHAFQRLWNENAANGNNP